MDAPKRRRWLQSVNREIPLPLAAALLVLALAGAAVLVAVEWSTIGLPERGAPGRHDWATANHYRQWRLELERRKELDRREHPNEERYLPLPAEALGGGKGR